MATTEAKAHGMDGSLVEPDWTPLTREEVQSVLAEFPECPGAVEILSVSPRPFSAASVVSVGGAKVLVKRHHRSVREPDGLKEEHQFIEHLRAKGASVPRVLDTHTYETTVERDTWVYEVHAAATGIDAYVDAVSWTPFRSVKHAFSAGQALAKLHLAARGFEAPARRTRVLVSSFTIFSDQDPGIAMNLYLAQRPTLANDAEVRRNCERAIELLEPFHHELAPLVGKIGSFWTHNDLHASNLFWSDKSDVAKAVAIIDFGLSDRTNAVYDLAIAVERNCVEWLALAEPEARPNDVRVHLDHMTALLDGYESVRPLLAGEAAALAPMTALCHAEFALSEADYFLRVLHSAEKARMAHDGYLVGHARWFRSDAGSRMLDAIRRCANERAGRGNKE
jgi:Ser/Thr protein kinase RdoA (MazF antagonist)